MKGKLFYKILGMLILLMSGSAYSQVYCVTYGNAVPSDKVITGIYLSPQCPNGGGWAFSVASPSNYLQVCNQSWPTANRLGWVTTPSASTSISCVPPGNVGLTYGTRPIQRPASNIWICDSTVPSGYKVTQTATDSQCSLDKRYNATRYYIQSISPTTSSSSSSSSRSSSSSSSSSLSVITTPLTNSNLPSFTTIKFKLDDSCIHPAVYTDTVPDGTPLTINKICFDNRVFFEYNYKIINTPTVIKYYRNKNQCWVPEGDLFNPAEGARVVLATACTSEGAQFTYDGGIFKHVKSGKCVRAAGNYSIGSPLILSSECNSFRFSYDTIPYVFQSSATIGHVYIHERSGFCLRPEKEYQGYQPGNPTIIPAQETKLVFSHRDGGWCNLANYDHKFNAHYNYQYGTHWGGTVGLYNVSTGQCIAAEGGSEVNGATLKLAYSGCLQFENSSTQRMLKTSSGFCVKPLSGNAIPLQKMEQAALSSDCSNTNNQNNFWRQANGDSQFTW